VVWWLLAVMFFCCVLSVWLRAKYIRKEMFKVEGQSSPLSIAIQQLITTAGGIYLAVVSLASFLKLDIPDKMTLFQISMDPLALSAIVAAIVQPLILRLYNMITGR
jgi:hypothetical protein